jgi:hypothetical protein
MHAAVHHQVRTSVDQGTPWMQRRTAKPRELIVLAMQVCRESVDACGQQQQQQRRRQAAQRPQAENLAAVA